MSASNSGYLSPDEITNKSFDTKRRGGFEPEAVKRHLAAAAATVHGLLAERASLIEQVERLQAQLADAEAQPVPQAELDEDALTERLGKDAARVLAEARAAAADRIAEAESQADDIRAAAEEIYAERSVLADAEASKIGESAEQLRSERAEEAERTAAQIVARAEADAETLRSSVSSERQSADAEAARIVREAELTRRQILEDLARRRSSARRQIEQLRAGRERLLASHETVRRALDDISEELTISMSEARAAAETAGHSVSDTTIEELEAEIETARLTGLLDTGPLPVVSKPSPPDAAPPETTSDSVEQTEPESSTASSDIDNDDNGDEVDPADGDGATTADSERSDAETTRDATSNQDDGREADMTEDSGATDTADVPYDVDSEAGDSEASDGEAGDSEAVDDTPATEQHTPSPPSGKGLADVVQLDLARNDVDTATHPATGRDTSNGRSTASKPPAREPKAPLLEAVESPDVDDSTFDADEEDSVGDLFATLRSTPPPAPKKPKRATKAAAKKSTAKKAPAKKSTPAPAEEIEVDSTDVARRLKRVLADEQSRAMSRVKAASEMPSLEQLLGEQTEQVEGYWIEVVAQIDDIAPDDERLRQPVDELVNSIRRRVNDALTDAGDDSEGVVSSLRSVYREVKTQRIVVCADQVCRLAEGRSADRA